MSDQDQELRAALRALRGESDAERPEAVAARVLAALPPGPPPADAAPEAPAPRSPLVPLLFGTLLGLVLGFGAARSLAPSAAPATEVPRPQSRPLRSTPEVLAVVGTLDSYGTRKNFDRLKRGDTFAIGSWLECGDGSSAALRLGPGIEIHLDARSGFRADSPSRIFAKEGRFYVSVDADHDVVVNCGQDAEIVARDAEFVVVTNSGGTSMTTLRGNARLSVGKATQAAPPGFTCSFDLKAGLTEARPNPGLDELVGWQARCLLEARR